MTILIPYAGDCPHRRQALDWVRSQYETLGHEVVIGEGNADAWVKAEAVADALARTDADLLVVADADVWSHELPQAIAAVEAGAAWAVPHRQVWRLTKRSTVAFMEGATRLDTAETHQPVLGGGVVVLRRATYLDCPLDTRFVGWGGEDIAFGAALRTLHGPPDQTRGRLWHLWHPPQPRRSRVRGSVENTQLAARYVDARTDTDAMRALVEEARCHLLGSSSSRS